MPPMGISIDIILLTLRPLCLSLSFKVCKIYARAERWIPKGVYRKTPVYSYQRRNTSRTSVFPYQQRNTSRSSVFPYQQRNTSRTSVYSYQQRFTSRVVVYSYQQRFTSRAAVYSYQHRRAHIIQSAGRQHTIRMLTQLCHPQNSAIHTSLTAPITTLEITERTRWLSLASTPRLTLRPVLVRNLVTDVWHTICMGSKSARARAYFCLCL